MKFLKYCSVLAIIFCLFSCSKIEDDPYVPSEWAYDRYSDASVVPGDDFYHYVCGLGIDGPGADSWAPLQVWAKQAQDFSSLAYSDGADNPVPVMKRLNELKSSLVSRENMEDAYAQMRERLSGIEEIKDIRDYPQTIARLTREGYYFFYVNTKYLDGHKFGILVTAIYNGMVNDWNEEWLKEAGIYDEYTRRLPKAREFEQYLNDHIKVEGGESLADLDANVPEECARIKEFIARNTSRTKAAGSAFERFGAALGNENPDFVPTDDVTRQYFEAIDGMGNDMVDAANAFLWCVAASIDINILFEPETMINFLMVFLSPNLLMNMSHTFCDTYTTAENIRKHKAIFEDLRSTMIERVGRSEWMTASTKALAREKLEAMECHTGILDWPKYEADMPDATDFCSAFHEVSASYITKLMGVSGDNSNIDNIIAAAYMMPMVGYPAYEANSFYLRNCNTMCILPSTEVLMDMNSDFPFINFVIAHEMCHGFDSEGCDYNARGEFGDWWTKEDKLAFGKKKDSLIELFNHYQVTESVYCNGALTINEDMADLGGMEIAWYNAERELESKYRGDELREMERRFFKSYAVFYAKYISLDDKIKAVSDQDHSLYEFRINGILNNIGDWYSLFDVTGGQKYCMAPELRVHFW